MRFTDYLRLAALVLALAVHRPSIATEVSPIDPTPAVVIGDHAVSNYLVAKYYGRFADPIRREQHREPSADESAAWLRKFLTQQVVIADAESRGFGDRPEVKDIVDRMERHMLTQAAGPYYQQICPQEALNAGQLRALFERTSRVYDARIVHFSDAVAAQAQLGADFDRATADTQAARIERAVAEDPAVEHSDGACGWPFAPWLELADVIPGAQTGRWQVHRDPDLGLYAFYIRAVRLREAGEFAAQQTAFGEIARHVRQQTFQRRHQAQALKEAGFSVDDAVAAQFASACGRSASGPVEIPPDAIRPLADRVLCTYRVDSRTVAITAEELRLHFNRQFIRTPLGSKADVRAAAAAMVLTELDLRAARAAGVDQTPQFVQDRLGFAGFQVLDFYEKQVLLPALKLGPSEVESFYREHAAELARPSRVRGRRLEFATAADAAGWLRRGPAVPKPAADAEVEVALSRPLAGLDSLTPVLLTASDGTPLGPFPLGDRFVVFVKEATLDRAAPPLAEVEPLIRERAFRPALDRREAELAREFVARHPVSDHLDYSAYRVTPGQVQPPWKS